MRRARSRRILRWMGEGFVTGTGIATATIRAREMSIRFDLPTHSKHGVEKIDIRGSSNQKL